MQKIIRSLVFVLSVLFIALLPGAVLSAKTPLPGGVLTKEEIRQLVSGKTAEVTLRKNHDKGFLYFKPNGEMKRLVNNWLAGGHWKLKENGQLCMLVAGEKDWACRMLIGEKDGIGQFVVKNSSADRRELTYKKFTDGDKLVKLAGLSSPPLEILDEEEIRDLFAGKTVESETVRRGRVSLTYYNPDGTLELMRNGKVYSGLWRVTKSDRMCLSLEGSKEKCRIIIKQGQTYSKYIVKISGNHQLSIRYRRFSPGKRF